MNEMELIFCNEEELMAYYMGIIQQECERYSITIEEYLPDYLMSNHCREFLSHLDSLGFEQSWSDCADDYGADDWDNEALADEADRLLDEYETLQSKS